MTQCWWFHLLVCRDGRTYAGIATDVAARFAASQQRQRREIHALQPSRSRAWRTGLRQQVRGTQGESGPLVWLLTSLI